MAKKLRVFVLFGRFADPGYYHIRRPGDKTKTLCNKEILHGETCTTKRPKKLKVCDMCKSILNFNKIGRMKKRKSAKRKIKG